MHTIKFYLSTSKLKDPVAIEQLDWRRSGANDETNRRCIPCCIPESLRGEANYMFRNKHNIWCCSRTLCSHPGRKSVHALLQWYRDQGLVIVPFILPVLFSSSIASYQSRQRIFCANNCFRSRRGRGFHTPFWSWIYGWCRRYWCKNQCRRCSYWDFRRWDWY